MTAPRRVVAVVLAAGRSERFGSDKLMHPLDGRPLGEHIARTLADISLAGRIAICPTGSSRQSLFRDFEIIENPHPEQGLGTSLVLGAQRAIALDADAILVCLVDMPYVTAVHLGMLLAVDGSAAVTESNGARSPPAVFAREILPQLTSLTGDHGARHLLRSAVTVIADPHLVRDFDTRSDFD